MKRSAKTIKTFADNESTSNTNDHSKINTNKNKPKNPPMNEGIVNPIFNDPFVQIDDIETVDPEHESQQFPLPPPPPLSPALLSKANNLMKANNSNNRQTTTANREIIDRIDSASNISASTVITNTSSTGGLLPNSTETVHSKSTNHNRNSEKRKVNYNLNNCADCQKYHLNNHHSFNCKRHSNSRISKPLSLSSSFNVNSGYAPYPPQWYYLLAADTKKFRKHRHTHYRRDCRQCREIVRRTYEQYYLGQPFQFERSKRSAAKMDNNMVYLSNSTPDSIGSVSLDHHHQTKPYSSYYNHHYRSAASPSYLTGSSSPIAYYGRYFLISLSSLLNKIFNQFIHIRIRSKASCGHSCLKLTILFYCCIAVIMSICMICYLTKMFGLMTPSTMITSNIHPAPFIQYDSSNNSVNYSDELSAINSTSMMIDEQLLNSNDYNETSVLDYHNNDEKDNIDRMDREWPSTNLSQIIRSEMIGLLISSALMIIFILGLIGAFLESILLLRIFGAILSYLFLLTFGSALYVVILLIISHVQLKLILSTISCAAVTITIHGLLAIAPFAFADLLSDERSDKLTETAAASVMANSTYFKYPSVRFFSQLPLYGANHLTNHSNQNFFAIPSNPEPNLMFPAATTGTSSQQTFYRDTPIESIPTSDESLTVVNNEQRLNHNENDSSSTPHSMILSENNQQTTKTIQSTSGQTVRFTDKWL